ncbi:MAG: 4'-phosphopantetheinyl transferase family protein [Dermatophilaceae bacterium]
MPTPRAGSCALRRVVGTEPVTRELWGPGDPATLHPDEAAVVRAAVDARRREFAAGRACARSALEALGHRGIPLVPGAAREPQWPAGLVGSITHGGGYSAAAVASSDRLLAIGIDVEPDAPLPAELDDIVMTDAERAAVEALAARDPQTPWSRIVFSAKESVYKTWFPLCRRALWFHQATVHPATDGTFRARILEADAGSYPREVAGSWSRASGVLLTGVVLSHRDQGVIPG